MPHDHDSKHDLKNPLVRWQAHRREETRDFFKGQFWLILKNVLGWAMILTTPAVGLLPGPGGVIWFIIGFALATIPGKRRFTTRMMRGRKVAVGPGGVIVLATVLAIMATVGLLWMSHLHADRIVRWLDISDDESERVGLLIFGLALAGLPLSWLAVKLSVWAVNLFIRTLPLARRIIRPWLRKRGIVLLPSRRQRNGDVFNTRNENEIVEISESNQKRINDVTQWGYRWLRRALFVGLTIWVFWAMIRPIYSHWDETRQRLTTIDRGDLVISVVMWAIFLGAVRALSWREILKGFGFTIPRLPAIRIWATSELARYIPGVIWQVVGRQRLVRPYGVRGSVCASSQMLELAIFVLANLIVAIVGVCWVGYANLQGSARTWLLAAMAATPLLAIALHPAIFYSITNHILSAIRKPRLERRLSLTRMFGLLLYAVFGLLWQSLAMWLLLRKPLQLDSEGIGLIAGAYCLAWTAGFVAFWAPAGAGVREVVLIGTLAALGKLGAESPVVPDALLAAVVILLRFWTVAAEMLLVTFANAVDFRGAFNMFDPMPVEKPIRHTAPSLSSESSKPLS